MQDVGGLSQTVMLYTTNSHTTHAIVHRATG